MITLKNKVKLRSVEGFDALGCARADIATNLVSFLSPTLNVS